MVLSVHPTRLCADPKGSDSTKNPPKKTETRTSSHSRHSLGIFIFRHHHMQEIFLAICSSGKSFLVRNARSADAHTISCSTWLQLYSPERVEGKRGRMIELDLDGQVVCYILAHCGKAFRLLNSFIIISKISHLPAFLFP